MQVLVASPGLSFHLHAPRVSPLRARAMADAGLQVEFLAYRLSSLPPDAPLEGIPSHGIREETSGARAGMMDFLSRWMGRVWQFIAEPFLVQRDALRRAFRAGTRVVYVTDLDPITMLPALWLTPRRIRRAVAVFAFVPYVFYAPAAMQAMPLYSRVRGRLNVWAARRLARRIHLVCDNPHVASYLRLPPAGRVHIVPEGHIPGLTMESRTEARRRLGLPLDGRIFLLFGTTNHGKGTDLLLSALEGLSASFHVCIVGPTSGAYDTPMDEHRLPTGWEDRLHLVNRRVSEEDRRLYFEACDAVVLPYRRGYATTSQNLTDAVDFERAVVVSDQHYIGEFTRQHGIGVTFEPENVDDLRRALVDAAGRPVSWYEDIGRRCARVAEELSWPRIGRRYGEMFARETTGGRENLPAPEGDGQ